MEGLLEWAGELPEVRLDAGDVLVEEGVATGSIWILESGVLAVSKGASEVNRVTTPGSAIGEVALLLGAGHGATVTAVEPCRLRHAADGEGFLASHPDVVRVIAVGLAERLNYVTSYLVDLKHQYGEAPGLAMVPDVLARLAGLPAGAGSARPGSARDPDPEY